MKKVRFSVAAAVALITVILLCFAFTASGAPVFNDVSSDDWFYPSVFRAAEEGIMIGAPDGSFSPDAALTRAQAVTVIGRMSGERLARSFRYSDFKDVDETDYYADSVGWAYNKSIVFGIGDGYFAPDSPVLRREFAALLYRFAVYAELEPVNGIKATPFTDLNGDWASDLIEALHSAGVFVGEEDGSFSPEREMTRAEVAAVVSRFLDAYRKPEPEPYPLDPTPENIGVGVSDESSGLEFSYVRLFEEGGEPIPVGAGVGSHGGHETRLVRTPRGTYATFITDATGTSSEEHPLWHQGVATFSIIKITSDGFHVIYQSEYPQAAGSCTPNVLYGENGKVYVTVICDNKDRYMSSMGTDDFRNGVWLEVFEVDIETDEVTAPESPTLIDHETTPFEDHGYGYTQPILDNVNGKLYAITCGGEGEQGYLAWFIYDLDTKTWDPECYTVTVETRRCYINGYPDGRGGFTFVIERCAQRGRLAEKLGLPFGGSEDGYVWDALYLYHIPDPEKEEYVEIPVVVPDYVAEGPRTGGKYYFDAASHYGENGCTYLDTSGRLHVIFNHSISSTRDNTYYHAIYDLFGNELYYEPIPTSLLPKNGTGSASSKGFAMTQGKDGRYFIFYMSSGRTPKFEVWASPSSDGVNFTRIMEARELVCEDGSVAPNGSKPIIANSRNHSVLDGVTAIMYNGAAPSTGSDAFFYFSVKLPEE